jgi:DNA-directed RNA polymerase subunit alpha
MRVGERTDFNRLRLSLETDGTITPREGLEKAIRIMINQLQAVVGFREEFPEEETPTEAPLGEVARAPGEDWVKSSVEEVDLPARTVRALTEAGIKTISGLIRKRESDLLGLEGLGAKSVEEIKKLLAEHGLGLKEEA